MAIKIHTVRVFIYTGVGVKYTVLIFPYPTLYVVGKYAVTECNIYYINCLSMYTLGKFTGLLRDHVIKCKFAPCVNNHFYSTVL